MTAHITSTAGQRHDRSPGSYPWFPSSAWFFHYLDCLGAQGT